MPEMIATSEIEYPPGMQRKPGDRFAVEEDHVLLLQTLKRAELPDTESMVSAPVAEPQRRPRGRPPKAR